MVGSQIQKYKQLLETIQHEKENTTCTTNQHLTSNVQGSCHVTILDNPTSLSPTILLDKLDDFNGVDVADIKQDLELFLQEIPT